MELAETDPSSDLIEMSNRLRSVRTACRRFVFLWAMSRTEETASESESPIDAVETLTNFRITSDFDWSLLYPRNECDD